MKFLILSLLALSISCGKSSSDSRPDSKQDSLDPVCNCIPTVNWTITSSPLNFPINYSVVIDGLIVNDTCPATRVKKEVKDGKIHLHFKDTILPRQALAVKIFDRGEDCENDGIFYNDEDTSYAVMTFTINGVKSSSVSVSLSN